MTRFWGPQDETLPVPYVSITYGPGLIDGLGCHFKSITSLLLHSLSAEAIVELSKLRAFEALHDLDIEGSPVSDGHISPIARWLCACKNLRSLRIRGFLENSAAFLSQVLVDEQIRLESLSVELLSGNTIHNRAFYESLASQSSLHTLIIEDFDSCNDDQVVDTLVQALSKLNQLVNLELPEEFSPVQVRTLVSCLPELQMLDIHGSCDVTDDTLPLYLGFKNLKILNIFGGEELTARGILNFVSQLGAGNQSFDLRITDADLSLEESATIRDALKQKADGTFGTY